MSGAGRDTIVAVATPPGRGGVAILRISGPRAHAVAAARLAPGVRLPAAGAHQLAWLQDLDGSRLDQALILSFHAPHSYTGEDVVEFHIHGAPFVVNLLLNNLLRDCAAADPGEFTRRAVENGRMRLDQAEGVRALSEARSGLAHRLALRALAGGTGNLVESLRVELLDLLAELEADLDFSEHEICPAPPAQLLLSLEAMTRRITTWQASWHTGRLAAGAQVVLVGAPNAGKSTLLNALAGQERALVDEAPGTTRDAIAVEVRLDDELSITLWDTAGLREDAHGVEARGQFLTRQQLERADLILHLVAPDQQPMPELKDDPRVILLHSKGDLPRQLPLQDADWLVISASTGLGLAELRQCMRQRLLSDQWQQLELVISEARHLDLLVEARSALVRASQALVQRLDRSLVAADVRDAAHALGSISGAIDFDELYPRIFSRFCIGK